MARVLALSVVAMLALASWAAAYVDEDEVPRPDDPAWTDARPAKKPAPPGKEPPPAPAGLPGPEAMISNGEKMIAEGEALVGRGEALISEGRALKARGERRRANRAWLLEETRRGKTPAGGEGAAPAGE